MDEAELKLPPDVAYVGLARLVVSVAARKAGMAAARIEDLKIAVSEGAANAVRAREHRAAAEPLVLRFGPREGQFEVTVCDIGTDAEPSADAADHQHWSEESDLGVTLIRGLADDVSFMRDEGMRVHMRFCVGLLERDTADV